MSDSSHKYKKTYKIQTGTQSKQKHPLFAPHREVSVTHSVCLSPRQAIPNPDHSQVTSVLSTEQPSNCLQVPQKSQSTGRTSPCGATPGTRALDLIPGPPPKKKKASHPGQAPHHKAGPTTTTRAPEQTNTYPKTALHTNPLSNVIDHWGPESFSEVAGILSRLM